MTRCSFATSLALASLGLALAESSSAQAQLELPRPAPTAKVVQQVGLTEIAVDYDRPAVNGRKIWGALVPYGQTWMIGTNPAARIKFSKDVTIADKVVPAGTYWLLATPNKTSWTLMLNKSPETFVSARDYRPDLDVVRVKVSPKTVPRRERLTFAFSDISDDAASLELEWETLRVTLPIQANTTQQILTSINDLNGAWRSFANAARYMLETKKDYDLGLKYVDEALALKEDWYCMWVKGALLAAKGDFAGARDWAERARALSKQTDDHTALAPDLDKAVADWTRRSGSPGKEPHVLTKVGDKADGAASDRAAAVTEPPSFQPAASHDSTPEPVEPSAERRRHLRHR